MSAEETKEDAPSLLEQIGGELFDLLFSGDIRIVYERAKGRLESRRSKEGLRIRLQIDPRYPELARLHGLPWEFLCTPEEPDLLGLSCRQTLVRYLEIARGHEELPTSVPLHILAVMANPSVPGMARLDLEQERANLEAACRVSGDIRLSFLEGACLTNLHQTLSAGPVHVLHFMGHGDFDEATGEGALLFEEPDGRPCPIAGRILANLIKNFPQLRLVVLNACDTARAARDNGLQPFFGMATALVAGGVPAVVAMQIPVADSAAIAFSRMFYHCLVQGNPVDAAAAQGRLAIYLSDDLSPQWAAPVLFLRASDGLIFAPPPGPSGAQPDSSSVGEWLAPSREEEGSEDEAGTSPPSREGASSSTTSPPPDRPSLLDWARQKPVEAVAAAGGLVIALGAGLGVLGLVTERTREGLIGISPPLSYSKPDLLLTGAQSLWSLPWRALAALAAPHPVLRWSAFACILLTVALLGGGWFPRRGPGMLIPLVYSAVLLITGAWLYSAAVHTGLETPGPGRGLACEEQLSRRWDVSAAFETCTWLINDTPRNEDRRQGLGGVLGFLLVAAGSGAWMGARIQSLGPKMSLARWGLVAVHGTLVLFFLRLVPATHAYSTWGVRYPPVTVRTDLPGCDQALGQAIEAGSCCAFNVSENAIEGTALLLWGSGCPGGPGYKRPEDVEAIGKGCLIQTLTTQTVNSRCL